MSIELFYTDHPHYLEIQVKGEFSPAKFDEAISVMHSEALARGTTRILCNCLQLTVGDPPQEDSELGASFARLWKSKLRIAIVAPRRSIEQLFKKADVDRWANVSVSSDVRSAPKWLLKE
jgi:hypothetical protein